MSKYIICSISNVDRVPNNSIIDRSDNRGVSDKDTRVQLTHSNRLVNIREPDNHEINCISIATAGDNRSNYNRQSHHNAVLACLLLEWHYYSFNWKIEYFKKFVEDKSIKFDSK